MYRAHRLLINVCLVLREGLWCKKPIKKGSRFGPIVGEKALEVDDRMDPTYIWEVCVYCLVSTRLPFLYIISNSKNIGFISHACKTFGV